jgi:hypothetical protein
MTTSRRTTGYSLTSHLHGVAGEKQQKAKIMQIPFLTERLPTGGGTQQPMVGMKLRPGVPLPTWICDTVSVRHHPPCLMDTGCMGPFADVVAVLKSNLCT